MATYSMEGRPTPAARSVGPAEYLLTETGMGYRFRPDDSEGEG
jgi:hypothetical protein